MGNDFISITEGSGIDLASDRIADIDHPRHKMVHGVSGVNDGDVAVENPLPVRGGQIEEMQTLKTIAFGTLTNTHADTTLNDLTTYTEVDVVNLTDAVLLFSWDEGSTDHKVVPAQSSRTLGVKVGATALWVKWTIAAPTLGNLYLEASR